MKQAGKSINESGFKKEPLSLLYLDRKGVGFRPWELGSNQLTK